VKPRLGITDLKENNRFILGFEWIGIIVFTSLGFRL
jgi:hypothetical protein